MNQKKVFIAVFAVLVIGIVGCFVLIKNQTPLTETSQPQQTDTTVTLQPPAINNQTPTSPTVPKTVSQNNVDDCGLIANSTFLSINQYEIGLGPNGTEIGYWRIIFQGNKFEWSHSDIYESGTYLCNNNILQVKFFDHSATAHYDGGNKILTWAGVKYKKVE